MANNIKFAFKQIKTEQFAILEQSYRAGVPIALDNSISIENNAANRIVAISLGFEFKQNAITFLLIKVVCYFEIETQSWESMRNAANVVVIEKGFLRHLVMLSMGTIRGVLHAKTEGTMFNQFIIPTINLMDVITEDLIIE